VALFHQKPGKLDHIPNRLKNKIFEKAFRSAEIAQFVPAQMDAYEDSLKHYRDMKNVVDTSFDGGLLKGKIEGIKEGKMEEKMEVARKLLVNGVSVEVIMNATGLGSDEISKLQKGN